MRGALERRPVSTGVSGVRKSLLRQAGSLHADEWVREGRVRCRVLLSADAAHRSRRAGEVRVLRAAG